METISEFSTWQLLQLGFFFIVGSLLGQWLIRAFRGMASGYKSGGFVPSQPKEVDDEILDLGSPAVRARLAGMLARYRIEGDANIRDGVILIPVPLDRLHPVFTKFIAARRVLDRVQNRNACSLYIRDSVNDRFTIVPELDLDDLLEATEVLRALVAEKQKKGTE